MGRFCNDSESDSPSDKSLWPRLQRHRQKCLLLRRTGDVVKVREPRDGRMLPNLNRWLELRPLPDAPETNDNRGGVLWLRCKERRPAFRAKDLCASIAARSNFDVGFRLTTERESLYGCRDDYSERRTREHLAVRAVAHHYASGIDFSSEGNKTAVTSAVDLHNDLSINNNFANNEFAL